MEGPLGRRACPKQTPKQRENLPAGDSRDQGSQRSAYCIKVKGVVQGVGFRPFVHNLATSLELSGFVLNSTEGVLIHVEGAPPARLDSFLKRFSQELPPLASIECLETLQVEPQGYQEFTIRESLSAGGGYVLVSPDIALCPDCLREMEDPADRRYDYPFINCTNCGPRYTIIKNIPYDRPETTMAAFPMCSPCRAEYLDPTNRRFHAQPISCPWCGPTVWLVASKKSWNSEWAEIRGIIPALDKARSLLKQGRILALKGLGGFHIACDATNEAAVRRLREAKRRNNKPLAVMCKDLETASKFALVGPQEAALLTGPRSPICLLPKREGTSAICGLVAPGNKYLGIMLPYTPLHRLLFKEGLEVLVMTSGNWSEEPIVAENQEALHQLAPLVDAFLLHDRDIHVRLDDSVVKFVLGAEQVVRRARGFVPSPIDLGRSYPQVMGCGAQMKNTFCLIKDRFAILSQHLGDLENFECLVFFNQVLEHLRKLYRVDPVLIAHDMHPDYLSTRWALAQQDKQLVQVQHHHAHVVSCMAEWGLQGPVIGVAFDGTGYGPDKAVWGGEFLVADRAGFRRAGHLAYVPLLGAETSVREPWRMAFSHMWAAGLEEPEILSWASPWGEETAWNLLVMAKKKFRCPPTSSAGRLFDAVCSLLGIRHRITFEGEAAMDLEMISDTNEQGLFEFQILDGDPLLVDPGPVIRSIWREVQEGEAVGVIGGRFHNAMAEMVTRVCEKIRSRESLNRVCLSGGVFQNSFLLERTVSRLEKKGFRVYIHRRVPTNDGGVSLGQAVVGASLLEDLR
ncbi:MAG: carbamoyltransferase HypF [bacterium]